MILLQNVLSLPLLYPKNFCNLSLTPASNKQHPSESFDLSLYALRIPLEFCQKMLA